MLRRFFLLQNFAKRAAIRQSHATRRSAYSIN
jgi:hypothetical protein